MKIKIRNYYENQSTLKFLEQEDTLDYEELPLGEVLSHDNRGIAVLDHLTDPISSVRTLNEVGVSYIIVALSNEQLELAEDLLDMGICDLIWDAMPRRLVLQAFNNAINKGFRTFIDNMNIMAIIADQHENIIYANDAFCEETGYAVSEAVGKRTNLLKSGKHSLMFYNNIKHTLNAGFAWGGTFLNKRKDASTYNEKAFIFPFEINGSNHYGKAAFNVTLEEHIATENKQALELAKVIQQSLLPDEVYDERITIRTKYQPLEHVSGDIYNVYKIDEDTYSVFLADVVGHGIGSSLLSTSIIAIANDLIKTYYMPNDFLNRLNSKIMELFKSNELPQTSYFTAIYLLIDLKNQKMHFANCGHPAFYLKDSVGLHTLMKINFFIGMFQNAEYEYTTYEYEKGSEILLFTDGVSEIDPTNHGDKDLLKEAVQAYYDGNQEKPLVQSIEDSLIKANRDKISDDITMIQINV